MAAQREAWYRYLRDAGCRGSGSNAGGCRIFGLGREVFVAAAAQNSQQVVVRPRSGGVGLDEATLVVEWYAASHVGGPGYAAINVPPSMRPTFYSY